MIIDKSFIQGSDEWQKARIGIPTASEFDCLITTKGEPSKSRLKYLYKLSAERITGIKENGYKNENMERGNILEAEARAFYELENSCEVEQVGICYLDEKKQVACSPDGLVGKDGLIEIKCPLSYTHVSYLLGGVLPIEYFQQIQGQLYITGRKWCDFFSHYPGIKPFVFRVMPDKGFMANLDVELRKFLKELDEITKQIRGK